MTSVKHRGTGHQLGVGAAVVGGVILPSSVAGAVIGASLGGPVAPLTGLAGYVVGTAVGVVAAYGGAVALDRVRTIIRRHSTDSFEPPRE